MAEGSTSSATGIHLTVVVLGTCKATQRFFKWLSGEDLVGEIPSAEEVDEISVWLDFMKDDHCLNFQRITRPGGEDVPLLLQNAKSVVCVFENLEHSSESDTLIDDWIPLLKEHVREYTGFGLVEFFPNGPEDEHPVSGEKTTKLLSELRQLEMYFFRFNDAGNLVKSTAFTRLVYDIATHCMRVTAVTA